MMHSEQINSLAVIGDIGAINASSFLSQMMGTKFSVSIPWVANYPYEKLPRVIGEPDELVTCVHLSMSGDLKGHILFIFPKESAFKIAALLQKKKPSDKLDEMDRSALKESGNILANAYLNAISDKLNLKLYDSVPKITTDMLDAFLDGILSNMATRAEQAVVLKNDYKLGEDKTLTHAVLLFDPDSYKKMEIKLTECEIKLT